MFDYEQLLVNYRYIIMLKALSVNQLLEKTKNIKLSFSTSSSNSKPTPKKAAEFIDSFTYIFILMRCHMTTSPLPK